MDKEKRFPAILDSFWLKILALLTMTIDHVGIMISPGFFNLNEPLSYLFRIIGRFALPLFCFMIAEGAIHTKSFKKYALRLGIMASLVSLIILGSEIIPFFKNNGLSMRDEGIIFLDLLLGATAVYCLRQDKWYIKVLAILPLLYGIASFCATCFDYCGCYGEIYWLPFFMRTQYGWYGILLIIAFYFAHYLAKQFIKFACSFSQIPPEVYDGTYFERNTLNVISALLLLIVTVLYYLVCASLPDKYCPFLVDLQMFAILAGVFILLYSGRRGYNKKWFQYGSYLYYLLHIPIAYLIVYLLALI